MPQQIAIFHAAHDCAAATAVQDHGLRWCGERGPAMLAPVSARRIDVAGRHRRRARLWHGPAIALLQALIWTFGVLPEWLAYRLADLAAVPLWLAWALTDRGGRRVRGYWRNVRIVYRPGGLGPVRPRGHLFAFVRHLAWLAVDSCRMHRLTVANVDRVADMTEFAPIPALVAEGKGLIWATGHIGAWEVAGCACALRGLPITSVFRPSPVPGFDRLMARLRTRSGQIVVSKRNVVFTLRAALRRGESIGLLADSAGRRGDAFPPFLGTPAATVATPALLHLATGAPIAVTTMLRTGQSRFRLRVWDVIRHAPTADRDADVQAILGRINAGLSRAVAEAPAQWFWQGRRFKHRPPGEIPGPDGLPPPAVPDSSSSLHPAARAP